MSTSLCRAWWRKISQISRDFQRQIHRKIGRFRGNFVEIFRANFAEKQSVKKRLILWEFSGQISLDIDQFCTDLMSMFNVFKQRQSFAILTTKHSRTEPMAKLLTS